MVIDAQYWIKKLELEPHPEGGFFREVYRSNQMVGITPDLAEKIKYRSAGTSIYFLLPGDSFSAFHRVSSDEIWHFYLGAPVILYLLKSNGVEEIRLSGEGPFQVVVPANTWFAAACSQKEGYALVGCTVSPGFEFDDFDLANRDQLVVEFPQHQNLIHRFTRK